MVKLQVSSIHGEVAQRHGITVTELLVVVGIIGLLMSLLLPAVNMVRAAARRTQCENNLHQIGVAIHHFHEQRGFVNTIQPLRRILPQMGHAALADEFDNPTSTTTLLSFRTPPQYLCPSDYLADPARKLLSYGISGWPVVGGKAFRQPSGPYGKRTLTEVTDGASNTALFSERLVRPDDAGTWTLAQARSQPLRYGWQTSTFFGHTQWRELAEHCRDESVRAAATTGVFWPQQLYFFGEPHYNHLLPPNNWPFTVDGSKTDESYGDGPVSPSSLHDGGAFVLLIDGSVTFVSDSIDMEVFWALGTIDGGEAVTW